MASDRRHLGPKFIGALVAVAAMGLGLVACAPAKPIVDVYGDSLVWEAQSHIAFQLNDTYDTRVSSYGGTALCDYTDQILSDARAQKPALVVLAFSGNTFTACMQPPAGRSTGDAWTTEKYRSDTTHVVETLNGLGVPTVVVGAPPWLTATGNGEIVPESDDRAVGARPPGYRSVEGVVNATYRDLVAVEQRQGVDTSFLDGGTGLRAADGGWTKVQSCMSFEGPDRGCSGRLIEVRSFDTVHFCPTTMQSKAGVVPTCNTWSSGAWRYAANITGYARFRLGGTRGWFDTATADATGKVTVTGWAYDPHVGTDPIVVHVWVDGRSSYAVTADGSRPDVAAVYPFAGASHGFTLVLPVALTPGAHTVCAYAIDGRNPLIGCLPVTVPRSM